MSAETERLPQTLERVRSPYQLVEIRAHPLYGNQLVIDGDLQISESDGSYNTAMACPTLTLSECGRVAILGGGDGGVLNELLHRFADAGRPVPETTLVDIDPVVMELSERHLPKLCGDAFASPNAEVLAADAFDWIARQRDLDAVIYDLTMDPVRDDMDRDEFIRDTLERIAAALRPGGMLTMQCCGHGLADPRDARDREQLLGEIREALRARFDQVVEQDVLVPSFEDLWTFATAIKPPAH